MGMRMTMSVVSFMPLMFMMSVRGVMVMPMPVLMMVFLFMTVRVTVVVSFSVFMAMPVQVFHIMVMIFMSLIQHYSKIAGINARFLHPADTDIKPVHRQLSSAFLNTLSSAPKSKSAATIISPLIPA